MSRRTAVISGIAVLVLAGAWFLLFVLPRWYAPKPVAATDTGRAAPAAAARKITATLYYVSDDGLSLVGTKREVPFADAVVEQARLIVEAQLAPPPAPLVSAVPAGTTLRALFLTERGDAFVDLSPEVTTKHSGGALDELFTVYAIVDALTVNLPAITRVQILVGGKEVDTIAGHVDVRHPLIKSLKWVQVPE